MKTDFAFLLLTASLWTNAIPTNMILFWGYPSSDTKYCTKEMSAGNFEECVDLCLGSEWCMLSYGNDSNCFLCDIYTITRITQSNSSYGTQVAIKVNAQNSCPLDFTGQQYTLKNGFNGYTVFYNDSVWTIDSGKSCPDSTWRSFPRLRGQFCVKVTKTNKGITRNDALKECQVYGAWLAGFSGAVEYSYILETAKSLFPTLLNYDYLTVWISGLMKNSCASAPVPTTGCSGLDAFQEFPYQSNFEMYQFPPGYPNMTSLPAGSGGYYQRCLQLTWSQQLTAYDGMVTNAACEYACNGAQQICAFSYACGVLAT